MARRRPNALRPFAIAGEPSSILRSTTLYRFTEDGAADGLLRTAEMLYDHALEAISWPEWKESATRSELRAIADDLFYCAAALKAVASELLKNEVQPADMPLCRLAAELSPEIQRLARRIERRVGPEWSAGDGEFGLAGPAHLCLASIPAADPQRGSVRYFRSGGSGRCGRS